MYIVKKDRLQLHIAEPGTLYAGPRFDWSAFITQVTLDGKHTFCTSESLQPGTGTGGVGLCGEFGLFQPVGYDDARAGERFSKLGVGQLTKLDDEPYFFMTSYPIQPYRIQVNQPTEHVIEFRTEPTDCRGYAAEIVKTCSVEDNKLSIHYTLQNTGVHAIKTQEYVHNFLSIDGQPLGEEYVIRLAAPVENGTDHSVIEINGKEITWRRKVEHSFYWRTEHLKRAGMQWELEHSGTGLGVRELTDQPPAFFALWGDTHVVSPEVFIDIDAAPGEKIQWTRTYEFYHK